MEITDEEIWATAKVVAEQIGEIPITFSTAVRSLKQNYYKNFEIGKSGYNADSRFQALRLLKSKSVLAPFFFASMTLYHDELQPKRDMTSEQVLDLHNPNVAANFLALLFYSRRIKKLCAPEAWSWLEKKMLEFSDIGMLFGRSVSSIGSADGVVIGTLRHLSLGLFISADNKRFQTYKRHLKDCKGAFDIPKEIEIFGTSHAHIGSILLQAMGFGVDYASAYCQALISRPSDKVDSLASKLRLTAYYIEALYTGNEPPSLPEEQEYDISDESMDSLVLASEDIREEGSRYSWLIKRKEDLTREQAPQISMDEPLAEDFDPELDKGVQVAKK